MEAIIKEHDVFQPNPGWADICVRCSYLLDSSQSQFPCSAVIWQTPRGPRETIIPRLIRFTDGSEECNKFQEIIDPALQSMLPYFEKRIVNLD